MEIEKYLRVPFAHTGCGWDGCNCWSLVVLAYREELGVNLPQFDSIPSTSLREAARKIAERGKAWDRVENPRPFDVAIMRGRSEVNGRSFGVNCHVGLVVDGEQILHTQEGIGPALMPISDPLIAHRIVEYRRYRGDC